MPEEQVELEKGCNICVYVMLRFKGGVVVDSEEEQVDMSDDPDEEDMDDVNLEYERGHH